MKTYLDGNQRSGTSFVAHAAGFSCHGRISRQFIKFSGSLSVFLTVCIILLTGCKTASKAAITPDKPVSSPMGQSPDEIDQVNQEKAEEEFSIPSESSPARMREGDAEADIKSRNPSEELSDPDIALDPPVSVPRRLRRSRVAPRALAQSPLPSPPAPVAEEAQPSLLTETEENRIIPEDPEPEAVEQPERIPPEQPAAVVNSKPQAEGSSDGPAGTTVEQDSSDSPPEQEESSQETSPIAEVTSEITEGDQILVELPGRGWIFLGAPNVEFIEKTNTQDGEAFRLKIGEGEGTYRLAFQRQNFSTGETEEGEVVVEAVEDDGEESTTSDDSSEETAQSTELELQDGDGEQHSGSNEITVNENDIENENQQSGTDSDFIARLDEAVKDGDTENITNTANQILENNGQNLPAAMELLENYVLGFSGDEAWRAAVLMMLARMYENEEQVRDMKKALSLYETVITDFPLSSYIEQAERRKRYINRHFIEIR